MYKAYYIERDYQRVTGKSAHQDLESYKSFCRTLQDVIGVPLFTQSGKPFLWTIENGIGSWYYAGDYADAEDAYYDTIDENEEEVEEIIISDKLINALINKKDFLIGVV